MEDLLSLKLDEVPVRKVQSDQRFPQGQLPTSPGQNIQPPRNCELVQDYEGYGQQADNDCAFSSTPNGKQDFVQPRINNKDRSPESGDEGMQSATERFLREKSHLQKEDHLSEWMDVASVVKDAVLEAARTAERDEDVFNPTRNVRRSLGTFSATEMDLLKRLYPGVGDEESNDSSPEEEQETEVFTTPNKSDIDDIVIDFNRIKPEPYGSPVNMKDPYYSPILNMSSRGHAEGDSLDDSSSPTAEHYSLANSSKDMVTDIDDFEEVLKDITRSPGDEDIKLSPGKDNTKRSLRDDEIKRSPGDDNNLLSARTDASYRTAVQSFNSECDIDFPERLSELDGFEYSPRNSRCDTATPTGNDSCEVLENLLSQVKLSDTPASLDADSSAIQGPDLNAWLEGTVTPDAEKAIYGNSFSNSSSSKSSSKSSESSQEVIQSDYSSVKSVSVSDEDSSPEPELDSSRGSDDEGSSGSDEQGASDVSAEEVPEDMYVESYDTNDSDDLELEVALAIAEFPVGPNQQVIVERLSQSQVPDEAAGDLVGALTSSMYQMGKSQSAPGDVVDVATSQETERIDAEAQVTDPKPATLKYATHGSFASSTGSIEEPKPIGSMSPKMFKAKWDLTQLSTESDGGAEQCRDMREMFRRQAAVSHQSSTDMKEVHEDVDPKVSYSADSGLQFSAGHLGPEEEEALRLLANTFDDSQLSSPSDMASPPEGARTESQPLMERYKRSVEGMHPAEVERLQRKYPSAFVVPQAFLRSSGGDDSSPDIQMVTDIDATGDTRENVIDAELQLDDPNSSSEMAPQTFYVDDLEDEEQEPYARHDPHYGTHTAFHLFDYSAQPSTDGDDSGFFNPAFICDDNVAAEVEVISENEITLHDKLKEGAVYAFGNLAYNEDDDEAPDAENSTVTTKSTRENGPCTEDAEMYNRAQGEDQKPGVGDHEEPEDSVEEYVDGVIKSAVKELQEHPNSAGRRGRRAGTPKQESKQGSRANSAKGSRGNSARGGGRGGGGEGEGGGVAVVDTEKSECCCAIV